MVVSRLRFLLGRPQSADTPARATHAFDRAEDARAYHGGPVLGASTLGELALTPALHDEAWAIVDRLEPDDNVSHVRDFVAEGRRLAGREWRYVDIASALAAATELLRPSSYLEVGVRRGRSMAIVAARTPKCSIIGVDMWQPNYAGMENPGPDHVRAELAKVGFAGDLELLTGDSHRVLPRLFSQRPRPSTSSRSTAITRRAERLAICGTSCPDSASAGCWSSTTSATRTIRSCSRSGVVSSWRSGATPLGTSTMSATA